MIPASQIHVSTAVHVLRLATLTVVLALKTIKEETVIDLSLQQQHQHQQRQQQAEQLRIEKVQQVLLNHHSQIFLSKISLDKAVS